MATREQLEQGIRKAYEKGEIDLAKRLAAEYKKIPAQSEYAGIAGHPATRFAYGAMAAPIGAAQLAAEGISAADSPMLPLPMQGLKHALTGIDAAKGKKNVVAETIKEKLRQYETAKEQGRKERGSEGFDWWELAGMATTPLGLAKGAAIKAPASWYGRMGATGAEGAGYGASMPVTEEDFGKEKVQQALIGGAFGAGLGGAAELGKKGYQYGKELFSPKKTAEDFIKRKFGGDTAKYKEAVESYQERLPGHQPTVAEALGQQQRKLQGKGAADLYSKEAIQLSKDLQKVGRKLDEADIAADIKMRELITGEKLTKAQEKVLKTQRQAEADINFGKATGTVPMQSNRDLVESSLLKAQQNKAKAQASQAAAMQDLGRFKTLQGNQASRAIRRPPEVDPMLTQLTGQKAPTSIQMGDIPGQPRIPARYTQQRSVEKASEQAAIDTAGIAKQRLGEQKLHQEISNIFESNLRGADTRSLSSFMKRPSVQKALKGVQEATEEAPERYGKWPSEGEQFTVAQLGRLKREIADTVRKEAEEGTIKKTQESEILSTLDKFNDFLKSKSSAYRVADEEYAKASIPIKRGVVSRELESKLFPESRIRQGAAYIKSIDDSNWLRRLTKGRDESIDDVFEKSSAKQKRAVKEMLLDQWQAKRVKGASQIAEIDGKITLELPHILSRPVVITNAVLKHFGKDLTPELHKKLELIMRDPNTFVKILDGPVESTETKTAVDLVRRLGAMAAANESGE